jgi:hypothetical protein
MSGEHSGNFSVAHIVMSAEALQRGGTPRSVPKGGALLGAPHALGETVVQATLSSFMHEQRKVPKERYLKKST